MILDLPRRVTLPGGLPWRIAIDGPEIDFTTADKNDVLAICWYAAATERQYLWLRGSQRPWTLIHDLILCSSMNSRWPSAGTGKWFAQLPHRDVKMLQTSAGMGKIFQHSRENVWLWWCKHENVWLSWCVSIKQQKSESSGKFLSDGDYLLLYSEFFWLTTPTSSLRRRISLRDVKK